jgi:hypothetical protein
MFGMEKNELIKKLRTDLRQLDQILSQWKGSEEDILRLRGLSSEMFEENLRLIFLSEYVPPAMDPLPTFGSPHPATKIMSEKPIATQATEKYADAEVKTQVIEEKPNVEYMAPSTPAPRVVAEEKNQTDRVEAAEPGPAAAEISVPEQTAPLTKEKSATTEKTLSRLVDAVAPPRLEDKLRNARVEDLKKAIPLHEKFLYINELYQGEHGLYNAFIELLNQCKDHKDAEHQFRLEIKGRGWDADGEIVAKLWSTTQRKFPVE